MNPLYTLIIAIAFYAAAGYGVLAAIVEDNGAPYKSKTLNGIMYCAVVLSWPLILTATIFAFLANKIDEL